MMRYTYTRKKSIARYGFTCGPGSGRLINGQVRGLIFFFVYFTLMLILFIKLILD